jgi:hypothetical protein
MAKTKICVGLSVMVKVMEKVRVLAAKKRPQYGSKMWDGGGSYH